MADVSQLKVSISRPSFGDERERIEGPAVATDGRTDELMLSYRLTTTPMRFYNNIRTATANSLERAAGLTADTPDDTVH